MDEVADLLLSPRVHGRRVYRTYVRVPTPSSCNSSDSLVTLRTMLFDTPQFVMFCVVVLLLAVIAYRCNALPKAMPPKTIGFQG